MNILSRIFRRSSGTAPLDLASPAVSRDPYPHYERLRQSGPVVFLPHHNAWIVLGYDELHSALTRPAVFSNRAYEGVDSVLLGADPPDHTAMRRIVARHFGTELVERAGALTEQLAASLLARELDVVAGYARLLSERVAAEYLGFDDTAVAAIRAVQSPPGDFGHFLRTFDALANRAVMYPRLVADGLGADDARSLVRLLWMASTKSVERTIAHAVRVLLLRDDVRATLAADLSLVPSYVEELLRLHSPELIIRRVTTAAVTLGGAELPGGAAVFLCVAAANRDPAKFADPASLRLDRGAVRHLAFGLGGVHHCVGAPLARRMVTTALQTLLARSSAIRAAEPLDALRYVPSFTGHELERLLITLERAP